MIGVGHMAGSRNPCNRRVGFTASAAEDGLSKPTRQYSSTPLSHRASLSWVCRSGLEGTDSLFYLSFNTLPGFILIDNLC